MTEPKLRVAASGFGGSGYRNPFLKSTEPGGKIPGVTTVLGAVEKPALKQWVADQTAAYAVANVEALLTRTEEQGFNMLRWYAGRAKESDFDDPMKDMREYHTGVLNDAAELGTLTHEWVEAYLNDWFLPELVRDEQYEMVNAFVQWVEENDIYLMFSERTVFGDGYAGTLDLFLVFPDGRIILVDVKTSRNIWDEHYAQLAALGRAEFMVREVEKGTEGSVAYTATKAGVKTTTYWVKEEMPAFDGYGILHIRPDDYSNSGEFVPAFCEYHEVPLDKIEAGWVIFQGAKMVREGQVLMKAANKGGSE